MEHRVLYGRKAAIWQDGIPVGNGRMGAMLYGGTGEETILLNHENLWLPVAEARPLKDTAWLLPKVRELAAQGRYSEIPPLWYENATAYPEVDLWWPNPFMPAGEIRINCGNEADDALRVLDMATGVATVNWETAEGTVTRRAFVSRTDNVVAVEIASSYPLDIRGISLAPIETEGEEAWDGAPIDELVRFSASEPFPKK
ncbi:MAG: glycoside hydrolase N-terminal domain-containing protein [Oscillospiraceae bacterium]